jgi:DnaJ-class molecular chaperone
MNAKEAAQVLGVQIAGLTHNDLSIAFARAAKLAHPDTAVGEGSIEGLDKAKKARDILREFIDKGGAVPVCGGCGGKGYVAGRFGNRTCPRCNGAG